MLCCIEKNLPNRTMFGETSVIPLIALAPRDGFTRLPPLASLIPDGCDPGSNEDDQEKAG
jgi:hypothetical protein